MAAVMFQGTGSDVGKSVLVAGVCRALTNGGLKVRPFKPQNMSNNAAVAADGGEIGRAQALQALACRVPASVHMNPVLIKPQSDTGAQIVVRGVVRETSDTNYFRQQKLQLLETVLDSFARLSREADIVVVEGAGSPAETNLRANDIANMGFARAARVPVVMIGDIDRGGVIASLVGTHAVLDAEDRALIRGFVINKFRGDRSLFEAGYAAIAERTTWRKLGIVPWLSAARSLPAEDAVVLDSLATGTQTTAVAVPMFSRIANFDDFDPLRGEPSIRLVMVPPGRPLPAEATLVILPGTKATIADLGFMRAQGWDIDLAAHIRRGGLVLGICGGYQMLGRSIADPLGIDGHPQTTAGLGYLPIETTLMGHKRVSQLHGIDLASGAEFEGYEIHSGRSIVDAGTQAMLRFADGTLDGAVSANGQIAGCYVHGLFDRASLRATWLAKLGVTSSGVEQSTRIEAALEEIADALEQSLCIDDMLDIARSYS